MLAPLGPVFLFPPSPLLPCPLLPPSASPQPTAMAKRPNFNRVQPRCSVARRGKGKGRGELWCNGTIHIQRERARLEGRWSRTVLDLRTLRSLEVNPLWGIVLTAPVDPSLPGNGFLSASRRSSRDPKPLLPSLLSRPFASFSASYDFASIYGGGGRVLRFSKFFRFFRFDRRALGRGEGRGDRRGED